MDLNRLGETVKTLRKRRALTQSQLAGEELTKGYISQIEHGRIAPSIRTLGLLASRLGCSLSDLVGPGIATSVLDEAESAFVEGDLTEAWAKLDQVGGTRETVPRYLVLASEVGARLGKERTPDLISKALAEGSLPSTDRARVLNAWGIYLASLGQAAEALDRFEQARKLLDNGSADIPLRLRVLSNCANFHTRLGDFRSALDRLHECLLLSRRAGIHLANGPLYTTLGIVHRRLGELAQAEDAQRRALLYYRADGDTLLIASSHHNLGMVYREMGHLDDAEANLREALTNLEQHHPGHNHITNSRFELARVLIDKERLEEAFTQLEQVDTAQLSPVDKPLFPVLLAQCQRRLGHSEQAVETLRQSASLLEQAPVELRVQALKEQAFAMMELGHVQAAQEAIDQSMRLMGSGAGAGALAH